MEFVVLSIGVSFFGFVINLFEDMVVLKNVFWKKEIVEGEILWFDRCSGYHCYYDVAVVQYKMYDMTQKIIISKSNKDKIGDVITIATNGEIAVRCNLYWKEDTKLFDVVSFLVLISLLMYYIIYHIYNFTIMHMVCLLIEIVVLFLLYPFFYSVKVEDCEKDLGWH